MQLPKAFVFPMLTAVSLSMGCSTTSPARYVKDQYIYTKNRGADSKEFVLIIGDSQFEDWFAENAKPIDFYSPSYYKHQNKIYSTTWNDLYLKGGGIKPFQNYIPYNADENYGVDLNHKLFWYFKYIEARYGSSFSFNTQL